MTRTLHEYSIPLRHKEVVYLQDCYHDRRDDLVAAYLEKRIKRIKLKGRVR